MATDKMDPCGVYLGTTPPTADQIFHSRDDGDSCDLFIDYLPPNNLVECGVVS